MDMRAEKHPWSGVGAFKESLGGKKITYLHSRDYPMKKMKYLLYIILFLVKNKMKGYTIKW
jgi:lipid II:glycine glycyltransferase (peptidoglycan interpeptide bridge formation enzyme)